MNLLSNLPKNLPEELTTVLQEGNGVRIERIASTGHRSPDGFWYDQPENEWGFGPSRCRPNRLRRPGGGSEIGSTAQQRHRVKWTSPKEPTVWVALVCGD